MSSFYLSTSPVAQDGKASTYNAKDPGSIPGWGGSPGEGNGNPLQYSCLENPTNREAWRATVHGVAKSRSRLSDFTSFLFSLGLSSLRVGDTTVNFSLNTLPLTTVMYMLT